MPSSQDPPYELPTRSAQIRVIKAGDSGQPGFEERPTPNADLTVILTKPSGDFGEQPTHFAEISIICVDLPEPAGS